MKNYHDRGLYQAPPGRAGHDPGTTGQGHLHSGHSVPAGGGDPDPRRNRISALLQRLGLPDSRYFAINTQEEVAIEAYKKDIVACNVLERVEEGFEKLQKLEQLLPPDDNLTRQFVVRSRALLGGLDGRYTHRQQMEMLMDAMRMTIPDFSLEDLEEAITCLMRVKTLNQIAGAVPWRKTRWSKRCTCMISC